MRKFKAIVEKEFEKDYYQQLHSYIEHEYQTKTIYPHQEQIFRALNLCDYDDVKVVILGQDPYHEPRQANGLAFSVTKDVPIPPSLQNIYKEMVDDLHLPYPTSGDLTPWAQNGVLLLNRILTVESGISLSHKGMGWETFTEAVIKKVNEIMFNFSSLTSELSRSSVVNEELDNKLSSTYEQINELKYHNSIISSQVKYYKKQCIEKDNYILYLKEKIKDNDIEPLSDNGDISVSYFNYNNIVLPERIKRDKFNDNNYNTITNNESCSKLSYEHHNTYGYDYKEESDRNIN